MASSSWTRMMSALTAECYWLPEDGTIVSKESCAAALCLTNPLCSFFYNHKMGIAWTAKILQCGEAIMDF